MQKRRIKAKVSDLVLNEGQLGWLPRNPRQWTRDDINLTKQSLERDPDFQEDKPILVTPLDKKLLVFAGNLRTTAAKEMKLPIFEAIHYVPESDEDRETIKRRAMLDNGSFGSWDTDVLANEWDDCPLADWGVPEWVTDTQEEGQAPAAEAKEDDFDEDKDHIEVRCKKGDVWQLGEHRLMCGDSIDLEQVKILMGGGEIKADMVFTDPPYGVAIGDKNKLLQSVQKAGRIEENIANDTLSVDELYKVLQKAMENARLSCKDDASYYVCAPPGGDMGLMMMMMVMKDAGLKVRHQIVWNKNCATFSLGRLDYDYKHEAIMYTWTKSHHNYRKGQFRTSVWDVEKPRHCDLHPTMKPIELVAAAIEDSTREGDSVLDLFGGSGSTMMACEQLNRRCYMMELDPHYCDVIIARWEKLTGKTAIKMT